MRVDTNLQQPRSTLAMRTFLQDLRFGLRLFTRDPGRTAVAALTLALGIAVNTTVFSWVDSLLLRPFPGAANGHELAVLEMSTPRAPNGANRVSYLDYRDYRKNLTSLAGLAVHREEVFSLGQTAESQPKWGELVSGNYFSVLGVKPFLGRAFTPEEDGDELGAHAVAVISHRFWLQYCQGDPGAVGKSLRVNQRELTVVGVAPPEFRGAMPGLAFDIWVPVTMGRELGMLDEAAFRTRGNRGLYALARLRPGMGIAPARAEAAAFGRRLEASFPETNAGVNATVLPVWEFHGAAPDLLLKPLRVLMAVAVLLLLIVCANVASLLLARSVARRREFGVRLSLGAGGFRLCRQLLTETLLLALAAAGAGLAATPWLADMLPALVPDVNAPVALGFRLNGRILAFTTLLCLGAALLAGLLPALFWLRSDVNGALKEGGRGGSEGLHSHRTRGLLVISEVALACLSLIAAGMFVRSFQSARGAYPGFDRNNVLLARFYLAGSGFNTEDLQQFSRRLRDRLRSAPGVDDVSYGDYAPLGSSAGPYSEIAVDGYVPDRRESMNVNRYLVAPEYFRALRIPLLEGREFKDTDSGETPPVVIVNESFARRYFRGARALGRTVRIGRTAATVVGVSTNSKYFHVGEAPRPHFYAPFRQRGRAGQQLYFFIRTTGHMAAVTAGLRREVAAINPRAGALDVMPLAEWTDVTLLPQKVTASMTAALGLISLTLAAIGLYSVMAYAVSQRTREIGIRMALGARPGHVLRNVMLRGMILTVSGLAVGIAGAFATMRLAAALLVNVSATDSMSFLGAALFLITVGALASFIPARRATKVDPITALRCD